MAATMVVAAMTRATRDRVRAEFWLIDMHASLAKEW